MAQNDKPESDAAKDGTKKFRTSVSLDDFAEGLALAPRVGDLLRMAGLRDMQGLAAAKITSSRIDALRAKATGDPRAAKKAKHAELEARKLARALKKEEARVAPEEATLGPILAMAGQFQLYGKVLDKAGEPVPNATVEISGKDTGALFTAKTDENGIYRLAAPVGAEDDKLNEGETLLEAVLKGDDVIQKGLAAVVKEGSVAHKILTVPLIDTIGDIAAPILGRRKPGAEATGKKMGSAKKAPTKDKDSTAKSKPTAKKKPSSKK